MIPPQSIDTPLRTFSLAVYGRDGVAEECLELQERLNLDINLLLFVAFTGAVDGVRMELQDIAAANGVVANWHAQIVCALRRARRTLKSVNADVGNPLHDVNAALRTQVKAAELEAEKIEQAMLWQWSRREFAGRPRTDRDQALVANLLGILQFYGADAEAAVPRLRDAAAAYTQS